MKIAEILSIECHYIGFIFCVRYVFFDSVRQFVVRNSEKVDRTRDPASYVMKVVVFSQVLETRQVDDNYKERFDWFHV